jgi:pimeloyl-ACP methyl ester carboxylesterase
MVSTDFRRGKKALTAARERSVERVVFRSRRGVRLVGLWSRNRGAMGVILCHGMESCKEGVKSVGLADRLHAAGCDVLRFDFSYVGESEGEFADLTVSGEVEDLAGAWSWMLGHVSGPIAIVGSSLGGTVALLFAATESGLSALATIAAVGDPRRLAHQLTDAEREAWRRNDSHQLYGMRLRFSFLQDVEQVDVLAIVPRIRCPLLITHGTADAIVPCDDAQSIADRASASTTVLHYEGADHRFSDPGQLHRLLDDIATWTIAHLRQAAGGEAVEAVS